VSVWDWLIVAVLNGSIIVYGIYLSRGVKTSTDWFLAGRSLPWWMVGVSMYATAIDASDLIADSGGTYTLGMRYLATNWVGIVGGWALAAYWIFRPMYRAGMYTNAEYLEARFGPASRVMAALVQVQYRTLVLAIMGRTIYLTLTIVCGWQSLAWWAVAAVAALATLYTALGGLRSVAVTDSLQFVVMTAAALLIWVLVFNRVGGFSGVEAKLAHYDPRLAVNLLHGGEDLIKETAAKDLDEQALHRKLLSGGRYDARRFLLGRQPHPGHAHVRLQE
jgi:SSS family solute:Na+ symporter